MYNITELTCRVCLQDKQILINVFEELEDMQTTLCKLLETCGDIQVDNGDAFPKYLCEECTGELLIAARFRNKCTKSKEALRNVYTGDEVIEEESCQDFHEIIEYSSDVAVVTESVVHTIETYEPDVCVPANTVQEFTADQKNAENYQEYGDNILIDNNCSEVPTTVFAHTDVVDLHDIHESIIEYLPVEHGIDDYEVNTDVQENKLIKVTPSKPQRKKSFKCDICGAVFVQAFNLKKHLQKNHAPVECYTCRLCDHWFTLETEMVKHESDCTKSSLDWDDKKRRKPTADESTSENHRKCVYCERDFPTPFALRMHLRTHTGERPYPCQLCNKSFKTQSSLNVHIKRHAGHADFMCSICGKTFFEKGNLDVHMRSHTGERPHVCTVCQKTFTRVFLLELHMRTHTGEKPYTCSYCDRGFTQRADLNSHISTHTGIKKYNCNLCKKGYVKRALLVQHMQYQHALLMDAEDDDQRDLEVNKSEVFNALDYIIEAEDSS